MRHIKHFTSTSAPNIMVTTKVMLYLAQVRGSLLTCVVHGVREKVRPIRAQLHSSDRVCVASHAIQNVILP